MGVYWRWCVSSAESDYISDAKTNLIRVDVARGAGVWVIHASTLIVSRGRGRSRVVGKEAVCEAVHDGR